MNDLVVVDAGGGNLGSVVRALRRAGGAPVVSDAPELIARARALVLPGQGAFASCAAALTRRGLGDAVLEAVRRGARLLGICLGLQILFEESDEHGTDEPPPRGLGLLAGRVERLPAPLLDRVTGSRLKTPHMGWNDVSRRDAAATGLFAGVAEGELFYFLHSYRARPREPRDVALVAEHGVELVAAVARENITAVQFHPEKSGRAGHALLVRFLQEAGAC